MLNVGRVDPLREMYLNIANRANETATGITLIDKEDKTLSIVLIADTNREWYDKKKHFELSHLIISKCTTSQVNIAGMVLFLVHFIVIFIYRTYKSNFYEFPILPVYCLAIFYAFYHNSL